MPCAGWVGQGGGFELHTVKLPAPFESNPWLCSPQKGHAANSLMPRLLFSSRHKNMIWEWDYSSRSNPVVWANRLDCYKLMFKFSTQAYRCQSRTVPEDQVPVAAVEASLFLDHSLRQKLFWGAGAFSKWIEHFEAVATINWFVCFTRLDLQCAYTGRVCKQTVHKQEFKNV